MTLESDFVIETYETYPIVGNNAPKDAPSINPNSVELIIKLVKNPSGLITGIQLLKNGDILLAQRFLAPLELDQEVALTVFKLQVEKIIGFPVNDMKMQVTLMGVSSNGCKRACPCCISPRENFRRLLDCLLQKMTALNPAIVFTFVAHDTAGDDSLHVGEYSPSKCKEMHDKVVRGRPHQTDNDKTLSNEYDYSVTKNVLLKLRPELKNGDGLHVSSGLINHFFNDITKWMREHDSSLLDDAQKMYNEQVLLLDTIEVSKNKVKDKSKNIGVAVWNNHLKSELMMSISDLLKLERRYSELLHAITEGEGELIKKPKVGKAFTAEERNMSEEEVCIKIEDLQENFEARLDALEEDDDATEANFYAQLLHGTQNLVEALTKFLSPNCSKRAHGKLEYWFDWTLQFIGGGSFSPEHGDHDQKNGKGKKSLEKLNAIMDACIVALTNESDEKRADFTKQLELLKKAGSSLYTLTKLMKQQDKLDPDEFIDAIAQFLIDLEIAFPGYKLYYNKLHFLSSHVIEFVIEYLFYGHLSVEGHESQHARMRKSMELLSHRGTNDDSRFGKHMSRQMLGLNSDVVQ